MIRKRKLLWKLFPSYLAITVIALIIITWFSTTSFRGFYLDQIAADLEARAVLIKNQFDQSSLLSERHQIDSLCRALGNLSSTRITVIAPDGRVIGDSHENPDSMDSHHDRPEVIESLKEGHGMAIRYSHTLSQNMMYVVIPLYDAGEHIGFLRTSMAITSIDDKLKSIIIKIVLGVFLIAVIAAVISYYASRIVTRPLNEMGQIANKFASGDLAQKLPYYDSREINALAESMNKMAAQLNERILTIINQRNESEAVLTSMVEGVMAIDTDERIIKLNRAAASLLNIQQTDINNKTLQEMVRNIELQRFVDRVLNTTEPIDEEIELRDNGIRFIQVTGTTLKDAKNHKFGALIVMNDVTKLHRLESVRQEFVANVSHELKTPVTSIKGFVETLQEGAIDEPESARKFLDVIKRQADRLNSIIEDLLTLSRLEENTDRSQIKMDTVAIRPIILSAAEVCELKANRAEIALNINCEDDLKMPVNPHLIEQALVNLIDNAIKYSKPNGKIEISAEKADAEYRLTVSDNGVGIAQEHLPRVFERFYIVDKARTHKLGGTGLGLAIVKHIAQLHGGFPTVKSELNKGTTFEIHIPG